MTPLDKSLKRALTLNGRDYVITLTPDALKVTEKGHRIGVELKWTDLISGDSALAVALHASLGKFDNDAKPVAGKANEAARPGAAKSPARARRLSAKQKSPQLARRRRP
jgi:hypothetical protein